MKLTVISDERYPDYGLCPEGDQYGVPVEITEEEFQRYQRVVREYAEIQAWLGKLSGDDEDDEDE